MFAVSEYNAERSMSHLAIYESNDLDTKLIEINNIKNIN